ncbi:MAG: DUF58 domain-containing protein, partial [Myxococcales bacterium]
AWRLLLPRSARAARAGDVAGRQAGASVELHDFREYQPGDDPRHVDWNAVARTGRLVLRLRREEVSPRVELLLDCSKSMALSPAKRARVRELAALVQRLCRAQGLTLASWALGAEVRRLAAGELPEAFDGAAPLPELVRRTKLLPAGLRILVSDLLTEEPVPAIRRLSTDCALPALVQVLDAEDESPSPGPARPVDAESGEALDRVVEGGVLARYHQRLRAHLALLDEEARRHRAALCSAPARLPLEAALRHGLQGRLLAPRSAR